MFVRFIDDDTRDVVRSNFDALVWARLVSNACYRYTPPFVAVIARGLDVSVGELGVALMVAEFAGLLSPFIGRRIDRANRLVAMGMGMGMLVAGITLAAVAPHVVIFAIGVFALNTAKIIFDTGLIVWVNDHVPYERRGRIVGVIETSWALGLFLGVSAMGLVTGLVSWRAGMMLGAVAMAATGVNVIARLPRHDAHPPAQERQSARLPREGWLVVASMFTLMGASQCVSITFGPWFEDRFDFSSTALVGVVVAMGVVELVASTGSSRVTDTWGKEASVHRGAMVMLTTALAMLVGSHSVGVSVPAVVIFMLGFEFAVVSILPLAAHIVPGASGAGLGMAVGAGTCGRAVFSAVATSLYEAHGAAGPAVASAVLAALTAVLIATYGRASTPALR